MPEFGAALTSGCIKSRTWSAAAMNTASSSEAKERDGPRSAGEGHRLEPRLEILPARIPEIRAPDAFGGAADRPHHQRDVESANPHLLSIEPHVATSDFSTIPEVGQSPRGSSSCARSKMVELGISNQASHPRWWLPDWRPLCNQAHFSHHPYGTTTGQQLKYDHKCTCTVHCHTKALQRRRKRELRYRGRDVPNDNTTIARACSQPLEEKRSRRRITFATCLAPPFRGRHELCGAAMRVNTVFQRKKGVQAHLPAQLDCYLL